jgi:hypothetical protein
MMVKEMPQEEYLPVTTLFKASLPIIAVVVVVVIRIIIDLMRY